MWGPVRTGTREVSDDDMICWESGVCNQIYQFNRYLLVVGKGGRHCSIVSDRLHRRQVTFVSGEVTFTEVKSPVLKGTLRPPHRKLSAHHLNPLGYDESLRELESRECNSVTFRINVTPLRAMAAQTFGLTASGKVRLERFLLSSH